MPSGDPDLPALSSRSQPSGFTRPRRPIGSPACRDLLWEVPPSKYGHDILLDALRWPVVACRIDRPVPFLTLWASTDHP